ATYVQRRPRRQGRWGDVGDRPRRRRSRLRAAYVAAADQAQVVAEMRLESARPVALPRLPPPRPLPDVGRRQMIERDVLPVAASPEATRAEHAWHRGERGDVLLVVPLVELGLEFGHDVHRVQQEPSGAGRRELIARQDLIALEAHEAIHARRDAL